MDSSPQWWSLDTVAVVTGGNKGIGQETVRQLAIQGVTVVMTARDENRGRAAMESLHAQGLKNIAFHTLDIQSPESVIQFANWLKSTYGGLDILVNNAGIANPGPFEKERAMRVLEVNYIGTMNMTETMLPLFKPSDAGARIVFISSRWGQLINLRIPELREQLSDPDVFTQSTINNICQSFFAAMEGGKEEVEKFGFPYSMSKILINAYSRLLAKRVAEEQHKIYVNSVHPGHVKTDMSPSGELFVEEGADTGVWLSLLPKAGYPNGLFFFQRKLFSFDG